MISDQQVEQTNETDQVQTTETVPTESTYSKYEPIIVATGIILVAGFIFILIKDWLKRFLTKNGE